MPWDQYGSPIGEDVTNPLIISPIGGSIVSEVILAKGVTDAAGTTSQFADGTKNFETGAFVGKIAKLTIDEIDYYRTILTNTGGTVIINPITGGIDAITIPSGTEYEILDYGLVNKFVPTDTDGDEKFTAGNPAVMQLAGSNVAEAKVVNVTLAGTRQQLDDKACREVTIIAKRGNTGYIYVGKATVSSTVYGAELGELDSITLEVSNTNEIYIDASVSGEGISYVAI